MITSELSGKIVIVGTENIGKSSIIQRVYKDKYSETSPSTIGAEFRNHKIIIDEKEVNLKIWDTAGQHRFNSILPTWIRDADIGLICFENVDIEDIEGYISKFDEYAPKAKIILVATKMDKYSYYHWKKAVEFSEINDYDIYFTSSKNNSGIYPLFTFCAEYIITLPTSRKEYMIYNNDTNYESSTTIILANFKNKLPEIGNKIKSWCHL